MLCDRGGPNRSFIKLLFPHGTDPDCSFVAYNVHTGDELVVMLDCKVLWKHKMTIYESNMPNESVTT